MVDDPDKAIGAGAVPVGGGFAEAFVDAFGPVSKPNPAPIVPTASVAETAKPYLDMLKIAFAAGDRGIADTAILGLAQKLVAAETELKILKGLS